MAYEQMSFAVGFNAEYGGIQNTLFQVQKKLDKTMERLSTGKRVNDMKDDEGGKAIADVMSSWKSGTDESIHNLKEFITMTKIAEKALSDIQDILFEMKQTIDRLNGIEEASARSGAQAQLQELAMAINKIVMHTEYKGFRLFNTATDQGGTKKQGYLVSTVRAEGFGTGNAKVTHYDDRYIRYGAGAEDFLAWDLGMNPNAQQLGMVMRTDIKLTAGTLNADLFRNLFLNGKNVKAIAEQMGIDLGTKEGVITAIREALGENVKVDIFTDTAADRIHIILQTPGDFVYGIKDTANDKIVTHVIHSVQMVTYEREFEGPGTLFANRLEGNAASIDLETLSGTDDKDFTSTTIKNHYTGVVGNRQYAVYNMNAEGGDDTTETGEGTAAGWVTANEGLFDINVMTNEAAALARVQVEAAIQQIDELRGVLAAMQHQAESLINQRMEESVAAEAQISHIVDTDYAKELAEFTKQQIAQQAGVNMLAQKRQMAQLITQLLR